MRWTAARVRQAYAQRFQLQESFKDTQNDGAEGGICPRPAGHPGAVGPPPVDLGLGILVVDADRLLGRTAGTLLRVAGEHSRHPNPCAAAARILGAPHDGA